MALNHKDGKFPFDKKALTKAVGVDLQKVYQKNAIKALFSDVSEQLAPSMDGKRQAIADRIICNIKTNVKATHTMDVDNGDFDMDAAFERFEKLDNATFSLNVPEGLADLFKDKSND